MKFALIAGLALTLFAAPAMAAEEDWLVVGGDGSALGYDRASIKKDGPNQTTLRYAVYSATALPPPPSMANSTLFGFTGVITIDCKDKTTKPGDTTYFLAYGGERTVAAAPKTAFAKYKPADFQAYFADVACSGRKTLDSYTARGRTEGVALLKKIAATPHVTNAGAKGWALATADGGRLLAVDTSSTKRVGDSVMQPEIAWMRKAQSTNGQSWRYYYLVTEYDCAKGRRRGNGSFRIYNDADQPVHEETIANAPWEVVSAEGAGLLEIACKSKKLAGLPIGPRSGMLARLKELAAVQ